MDDPPGPLIASGRSADIYDLGDGRVVRRLRSGSIGEHEVTAMRGDRLVDRNTRETERGLVRAFAARHG